MSITKTALLQQAARDMGVQVDEIRTPVENFLENLIRALSAGKAVRLKHFGVFHPDGRFEPSPSMQSDINKRLSSSAMEMAAEQEPATRGDINRLIDALAAAGVSAQPTESAA